MSSSCIFHLRHGSYKIDWIEVEGSIYIWWNNKCLVSIEMCAFIHVSIFHREYMYK